MGVNVMLRAAVSRSLLGLLVMITLCASPAFPLENQDSQIFIAGFNAYQNKDYQSAIDKLSQVLQKYPNTPLRDMAIFWLARTHFKAGHQEEAGRYIAQFYREYPDSPLKKTVEPELAKLAVAYDKGVATQVAGKKDGAEQAKPVAERPATEQAAAEKATAEKGAAEVAAAERAVTEKVAKEKAAAENLAAEKAAEEKAVAAKAAVEKLAAEKAAAGKAAKEKVTADKAAADKRASEKAAAENLAAVKAAAEKAAKKKAAVLQAAADKSARQKEKESAAAVRREARSAALKEKAIAGYKAVIDRYPASAAAVAASVKLKELGIVYPPPVGGMVVVPGENARILSLEVGQIADLAFTILPAKQNYVAGGHFSIPFTVENRGNGPDGFFLESGLPPEFNARFAAVATPDISITVTPQLAPGEKFDGVMAAVIPRGSIDGQKIVFPIKVGSRSAREVSQSREISLVASAPLLRGVINPDKDTVMPGAKVAYRVAILNVGSAAANGVTLRLNYPPLCEPVDFLPTGFRQEMKGALVLDGLKINSGESREFTVAFQVKDDAPARQELFLRVDLVNDAQGSKESFLSAATTVQGVSGVAGRTNTEKLLVIPGQTVTVPFVVTNTGNMRESLQIRPVIPAGLTCRIFQDLKRDGIRQPGAPAITLLGPLAPRQEAYLLMELATPPSAADGSETVASVVLEPENQGKNATVTVRLRFARPIVELAMTGPEGKLKPGDVSSFELNVVNRGSNLAKVVELQSILPDILELIAAEPPSQKGKSGDYAWKFAELGAGEKRSVRITYRVKAGIPVGTRIQIKNLVNYEDQLGNRY